MAATKFTLDTSAGSPISTSPMIDATTVGDVPLRTTNDEVLIRLRLEPRRGGQGLVGRGHEERPTESRSALEEVADKGLLVSHGIAGPEGLEDMLRGLRRVVVAVLEQADGHALLAEAADDTKGVDLPRQDERWSVHQLLPHPRGRSRIRARQPIVHRGAASLDICPDRGWYRTQRRHVRNTEPQAILEGA